MQTCINNTKMQKISDKNKLTFGENKITDQHQTPVDIFV